MPERLYGTPKFWSGKEPANDLVVQVCILLSLVFWFAMDWKLDSLLLGLGAIILGPITGFIIGVCLMMLLCTFFRKRK
jgi:hypothetical protein